MQPTESYLLRSDLAGRTANTGRHRQGEICGCKESSRTRHAAEWQSRRSNQLLAFELPDFTAARQCPISAQTDMSVFFFFLGCALCLFFHFQQAVRCCLGLRLLPGRRLGLFKQNSWTPVISRLFNILFFFLAISLVAVRLPKNFFG
jgi:hypothetical protein